MALDGSSPSPRGVRLSPGLTLLRTIDREVAGPEARQSADERPPKFNALAFDPSGKSIALASIGGGVSVHDVEGGAATVLDRPSLVTALAFHPDGMRLCSGNMDGSLKLWDLASREGRSFRAHSSRVRTVAFDHTGTILASVGGGPAKLWAGGDLAAIRMLEVQERAMAIAFQPGEPIIAIGGSAPLTFWNQESGSRKRILDESSRNVSSLAFDPRGAILAAGGADGSVRLWEVDSGEKIRAMAGHEGAVTAVEFSPDGRLLAYRTSEGTVHLHRRDTWEPVAEIHDLGRGPMLAFHPSAPLLAAGSAEQVLLVRLELELLLGGFPPQPSSARAVPGGRFFVSYAEEDGALARTIVRELEARGYGAWYFQRDSTTGLSYLEEVARAIKESNAVLVIISPDSMRSRQVTNEIVMAHEEEKPFLPLRWQISHDDFKKTQPGWRVALGGSTTLEIPAEGPVSIMGRIEAGLVALGLGAAPRQAETGRLIYASDRDPTPFHSWTPYSTGDPYASIRLLRERDRDVAELEAFGSEHVGVNLRVWTRFGRIEVEVQVVAGGDNPSNLVLYAIPMQKSRAGLIEVGAGPAAHPGFPYRGRQELEASQDDSWRRLTLDFDFRDIPTADYCIVAPRINEGCHQPRAGMLRVGTVKVWSFEPD